MGYQGTSAQGGHETPRLKKTLSTCCHRPPQQGELAAAAAKSLQSCPTLCDPIDGSPPGTSIPGILQARTLEWVAISFSKGEVSGALFHTDWKLYARK